MPQSPANRPDPMSARLFPRTLRHCRPATAVAAVLLAAGPLLAFAPFPALAEPRPQAAVGEARVAPATRALLAGSRSEAQVVRVKQAAARTPAARSQGIAILVNDEPITNYEIEMRQRLMGLSDSSIGERAKATFQRMLKDESTTEQLRAILKRTIDENPGKSREQILAIFEGRKKAFAQSMQEKAVASARSAALPALRKKAEEELIEERLKLQEAKRLNVLADDAEVSRIIGGMAERNKMNEEQFGRHLKGMGADLTTMRSRITASISWNNVIRRRFGHQIAITERDLDRAVATVDADATTELNVQRVTLLVASNLGETEIAKRLNEASALRRRFTGCDTTASLAKTVGGTRFENLGPTEAQRIPEPTRTLLLSAQDGEMLPASIGGSGIELWVLCGRKAVEADATKRDEAAKELRQREFEVLATRHLKDLRQDAHIEYR